jgi:hypothetical protein
MGPLSGKQHREYLKFQNKEAREAAKMELDEKRKQQLHEIKLQEAAAKANQGLGHKQQVNNAKLKEMGIPPAKMNKQKLGIPTQNPLAGTGMFKQGQRSLAQPTVFEAKGTDTVPAMLTPGEAVIPRAAAQDPKNKKAIKRMVQEGRKANAMRDGAVDVRYSDAPAQAKYHSQGTAMVVPSLAYEHSDVPGSSYADGTEHVFSRGSADMQHYSMGTYGVVPQQIQSAAGYFNGDEDIDEEKKRQGVVPMIIQPTVENIPVWDDRYPVDKAEEYANTTAIDRRPTSVVTTPVANQTPSNAVITEPPVVSKPVVTQVDTLPTPAVNAVPEMFNKVVETKPVVTQTVAPLAVALDQMTTEQLIERDKTNIQNTPTIVVPAKEDPYDPAKATRKVDFITDPVQAANKVRSVADIVQELSGTKKTEKSFTDSLANLFTANGFKEELGLNNQDIIRMAISTAVGAKKFGVNRALAFAGRQAFEDSSKRNAQQQAENKAIRAAAVQIHGQEVRDARAEENALATEKRAVTREEARREHDRFIAAQQTKMAEIKEEYNRTRDANRFEQQMRVLAAQQAQQDKRLQATLGNQWAMLFAREDLKNNSPVEQLKRLEQHTEKAAMAVDEIYKRELGSADVRDQANPLRKGIPTPKQATQQSLSYLKNSGFNITNPDVAQEATALINQATEQMIADKVSGRVKEVGNIAPYLARNIVTHRMGLQADMFTVGNKPMPAEKVGEIYSLARRAASDKEGNVSQKDLADGVNKLATVWNSPEGKKYREQFKGTENETAFAQFLKSRLENQLK